jgi:hypothetical protein
VVSTVKAIVHFTSTKVAGASTFLNVCKKDDKFSHLFINETTKEKNSYYFGKT